MCIWGVGGELVKASNKWNLLDCKNKTKQNKTKQNNPIPEFPVEFLVTPFLSESVDQNSHVQPKGRVGGEGGRLIFWGCLLFHSEGNLEVVLIFLGCVIFGETQYLLVTGP